MELIPPVEIPETITDKEWPELFRLSTLKGEQSARKWLNALVAIYRVNRRRELEDRPPPRDTRNDLESMARKAKEIERWLFNLERHGDLLDAFVASSEGTNYGTMRKNADLEIAEALSVVKKLRGHLDRAAAEVKPGTPGGEPKTLPILIQVMDLGLRIFVEEQLKRTNSDGIMEFPIKFFEIADRDFKADQRLTTETISYAIKEYLRGVKEGDGFNLPIYTDLLDLFPPEWHHDMSADS